MASREEYLKRYLSNGSGEKKTKKQRPKEKKLVQTKFKIVEDDADVPRVEQKQEVEEVQEIFSDEEEDEIKPIVMLVGNQTDELKLMGKFQTANWTSIQHEEEKATTSARQRSNDERPPRRLRHGSPDDLSPTRRGHRRNSSDVSPPRRSRHDSNEISPPRRRRRSNDQSPPRRRKRHSSSDDSPPRRRGDLSKDQSPPRRTRRGGSSDMSPPRGKTGANPPRHNFSEEEPRRASPEPINPNKPIRRNTRRKEPTAEQKKRAEELAAKYSVWNKGQKQVKERKEKLAELAAEASKPFARHRDDEDLEGHLKSIEHNEDPMLQYMREKKKKETGAVDRPKYNGPWPSNRYGIPPGYRWDGVDRSNGFETKLMSLKNVTKAEEEEYYKWSSGRFE